jgi:predicted enzyme related to lactoylglutathione lyase
MLPRYDPHCQAQAGVFCWIELATNDQAAAKQFYTSLFGWAVEDSPIGPDDYYSMFQVEGQNVGAAFTLRKEQQGVPANWGIYISVENADSSAARAAQLGAKTCAAPFDVMEHGRMAVLQDPTGATFSIWQPKAHPGMGIAGVDGTLCWADLSTPDVAASRFYSNLFGWKIAQGEHDTSGYLHIMNGDDFIGGILPSAHLRPGVPPHWLIYCLTSNCDATAAKAKQLGAKFFLEPMTMENVGRMAVLADRQGAAFAIFQPMRK